MVGAYGTQVSPSPTPSFLSYGGHHPRLLSPRTLRWRRAWAREVSAEGPFALGGTYRHAIVSGGQVTWDHRAAGSATDAKLQVIDPSAGPPAWLS